MGKIAKGPALKLVADVRTDKGGGRFNALSLQRGYVLTSGKACNAEAQALLTRGIKARPKKSKLQKHK